MCRQRGRDPRDSPELSVKKRAKIPFRIRWPGDWKIPALKHWYTAVGKHWIDGRFGHPTTTRGILKREHQPAQRGEPAPSGASSNAPQHRQQEGGPKVLLETAPASESLILAGEPEAWGAEQLEDHFKNTENPPKTRSSRTSHGSRLLPLCACVSPLPNGAKSLGRKRDPGAAKPYNSAHPPILAGASPRPAPLRQHPRSNARQAVGRHGDYTEIHTLQLAGLKFCERRPSASAAGGCHVRGRAYPRHQGVVPCHSRCPEKSKGAPKSREPTKNKKRNWTQLGRNWPYPAWQARLVNHRKHGGGGRTRTYDLRIMRPSL